MKTMILLLIGLLLLCYLSINAEAELVIGTNIIFQSGNENYTVDSGTMKFSRIQINDTWMCFNDTGFNITSPNYIDISLENIATTIIGASVNTNVLSFKADTTGGKVWFNISGFEINQSYDVRRDNVLLNSLTSNATGVISFSSNIWSVHSFDILEDNQLVQVNYGRETSVDTTIRGWDNTVTLLMVLVTILIVSFLLIGFYMIKGGQQ